MRSLRNWLRALYIPEDRTFSANSSDGVTWLRDRGVRLEKNHDNPADASFYCYVHQPDDLDGKFEMFHHSAYLTPPKWASRIVRRVSIDGLNWKSPASIVLSSEGSGINLEQIRAPFLKDFQQTWRLYFSAKGQDGITRIHSAVSIDRLNWTIESGWRISPDMLPSGKSEPVQGISDTSIIDLPDGSMRMFFSVYRGSIYNQNICSAVSHNGFEWVVDKGVRVDYGAPGCRMVVNNPSVIKIENSWAMYFRGSNNLPIRDKIYKAISPDSLEWKIEGEVLSPDPWNLKERHEIAHPFVFRSTDGIYRMFYTGCGGTILDRFAYQYYEKLYKEKGITVIYD